MLNKKVNRDKKNKIKIKDNELDKGLSDLDSDLSHSSEKSNPKIKNLTPKSNNSIDENPIEKKQHLNIHELKNQIEKKSKNQKPPSKKQFQKIAYPSSPSSSPEKIEVQKDIISDHRCVLATLTLVEKEKYNVKTYKEDIEKGKKQKASKSDKKGKK